MTPEENKRQRHLAEMMIAQCEGKLVQYRERDGEWIPVPYMIYNIADSDKLRLQWRIKPEPREWWICEQHKELTPGNGSTKCKHGCSHYFKVREVLND